MWYYFLFSKGEKEEKRRKRREKRKKLSINREVVKSITVHSCKRIVCSQEKNIYLRISLCLNLWQIFLLCIEFGVLVSSLLHLPPWRYFSTVLWLSLMRRLLIPIFFLYYCFSGNKFLFSSFSLYLDFQQFDVSKI